ncbi:MAG: hypothetical protein M1835_003466 [Candelina submexicana]|nr:MAG: hypothetical protein M1835_003466 [Candelina submexicana]
MVLKFLVLLSSLLLAAVQVSAGPFCLEEFGRPTPSNCGKAIDSMLRSVADSRLPRDAEYNFRVPATQADATAWASLLNTRFQLFARRRDYWLPLVWAHDDCALVLAVERIHAVALGTWNGIAELATRINNTCADNRSGPGYGGEDYDTIASNPSQPSVSNVLVQLRAIVPPNSQVNPARLSSYYTTHETLRDFIRDVADGNPWLSSYADTGSVHLSPSAGAGDLERIRTVSDGVRICNVKEQCKSGFSCFAKQIGNSVLVYGTTLISSIGTCASDT